MTNDEGYVPLCQSKPTARELLDRGSYDRWAYPQQTEKLAARVEKVLARHIPVPEFRTLSKNRGLCWECGKPYPCPTINDLNGEDK